jgi:endonuclease YncB( thermonuclease family)
MRSALALLVVLAAAACGGDPLDRLAEGERGRVEAVFMGGTFRLADGTEVRLAGLDVPGREDPGGPRAQAALARLIEGRDVGLLYGGPRRDGYDRALAHARTVGGRRWVQGALLDAGLARVRTRAEDRAMATEMLRREARARAKGQGLWADAAWRVLLPDEVGPGFVLVEGRAGEAVRSRAGLQVRLAGVVREVRVTVPRKAAADLEAAGAPVAAWPGRLLRIRGVARPILGGTIIRVDHPEQVEVLRDP